MGDKIEPRFIGMLPLIQTMHKKTGVPRIPNHS